MNDPGFTDRANEDPLSEDNPVAEAFFGPKSRDRDETPNRVHETFHEGLRGE